MKKLSRFIFSLSLSIVFLTSCASNKTSISSAAVSSVNTNTTAASQTATSKNIPSPTISLPQISSENPTAPSTTSAIATELPPNLPEGERELVTPENMGILSQIEGLPFYYYRDAPPPEQGIIQYDFSFLSYWRKTMQWSIGYFDSEGINTYQGTYSIDEAGLFTATLKDEYKNAEVTIKFKVEYMLNRELRSKHLVVTLLECSDTRFADLIGLTLGYNRSY